MLEIHAESPKDADGDGKVDEADKATEIVQLGPVDADGDGKINEEEDPPLIANARRKVERELAVFQKRKEKHQALFDKAREAEFRLDEAEERSNLLDEEYSNAVYEYDLHVITYGQDLNAVPVASDDEDDAPSRAATTGDDDEDGEDGEDGEEEATEPAPVLTDEDASPRLKKKRDALREERAELSREALDLEKQAADAEEQWKSAEKEHTNAQRKAEKAAAPDRDRLEAALDGYHDAHVRVAQSHRQSADIQGSIVSEKQDEIDDLEIELKRLGPEDPDDKEQAREIHRTKKLIEAKTKKLDRLKRDHAEAESIAAFHEKREKEVARVTLNDDAGHAEKYDRANKLSSGTFEEFNENEDRAVEKSAQSIQTGPKGGRYYIGPSGERVYVD